MPADKMPIDKMSLGEMWADERTVGVYRWNDHIWDVCRQNARRQDACQWDVIQLNDYRCL